MLLRSHRGMYTLDSSLWHTPADRPVLEGSYLLRFLGFARAFVLCGVGFVANMRRTVSSNEGASGSGFFGCMVGV